MGFSRVSQSYGKPCPGPFRFQCAQIMPRTKHPKNVICKGMTKETVRLVQRPYQGRAYRCQNKSAEISFKIAAWTNIVVPHLMWMVVQLQVIGHEFAYCHQ